MAGDALELIAVEVSANLDKLDNQMQGASRVVDVHAQRITQSVQRTEQSIVRASDRSGEAMNRTGGATRQLAMQFSQMGQQVAAGTSPLQALAIQLPDLAVVMGQAGGSASRFASILGGPWAIALTTAAALAIPFIANLAGIGDEAAKSAGKVDRMTQSLDRLRSAQGKVTMVELGDAQAKVFEAQAKVRQLDRLRAAAAGNVGLAAGVRSVELKREDAQRELETAQDLLKVSKMRAAVQARAEAADLAATRRTSGGGVSSGGGGGGRTYRAPAIKPERELVSFDDLAARMRDDILSEIVEGITKTSEADWQDIKNQIDNIEQYRRDEREMTERQAFRMQEDQVRTVSGLFEDAFRGGTSAIWDDFKAVGMRVVAEVAARFLIATVTGGSFSLGGAISSAVGSALPGFATGGSMIIGGRGGTDNNVLALNGRPIAKVSAGEHLNIVNPSLSRAGGGNTIISAPQFNLNAPVVTAELYADMQRISNESATRAGGAAYAQSQRSAPATINKYNQLQG